MAQVSREVFNALVCDDLNEDGKWLAVVPRLFFVRVGGSIDGSYIACCMCM